MSPEERLEALREDARWSPITLYPEHGRMPVPVRPRPWRALVGTAIAVAVIAAVFGGFSLARGLGGPAVPAPYAGTPTATVAPATAGSSDDLSPAQLLALAELPPGARVDPAPGHAPDFPAAGVCGGLVSTATAYWTVPDRSISDTVSWLAENSPRGMSKIAAVASPENSIATGGYLVVAAGASSTQGLIFGVTSNAGGGVEVRVDAVSLDSGIGCVLTTEAIAAEKAAANAAAFDAAQAAAPDAASRQRAKQWAASAVVPAGAVESATEPTKDLDAEGPTSWWCAPSATATRYWTLHGTSNVDEVANWLRQHATPGLEVANPSIVAVNPNDTIASVTEMPTPSSVEGMDFEIAQLDGNGVAIRAVASALSATHSCLDPGSSGQFAVGG